MRYALALWIDRYRIPASVALWLGFLAAICLAGLFLAPKADAGTSTLTWTHPTQFTDNTPLSLSQIASTTLQYGTCPNAAPQGQFSIPIPATNAQPTQSATVTVPPGTWCWRAFTVATAAAGGGTSGPTNVVQAPVIGWPDPKPGVLSSTITVAWMVIGGDTAIRVGTIELGTPCQPTPYATNAGTLYKVDAAAVKLDPKWRKKAAGQTLATRCAAV